MILWFAAINVRRACEISKFFSWCSSWSITREELDQTKFSRQRKPLFQKNLISTSSQVSKKSSYSWQIDYQKTMCSLRIRCLRSAMLGSRMKIRPFFSHREYSCFFSKVVFRHPRSYRIDNITCTIFVTIPSGSLSIVARGLSYSIVWERNGQYSFFTGERTFLFFQNLCFPRPIRCYRNDRIYSTITVKIPCDA